MSNILKTTDDNYTIRKYSANTLAVACPLEQHTACCYVLIENLNDAEVISKTQDALDYLRLHPCTPPVNKPTEEVVIPEVKEETLEGIE